MSKNNHKLRDNTFFEWLASFRKKHPKRVKIEVSEREGKL